uniref:Ribosomal protein L16 n=1 Tax=Globodera rostochiensis TaxID=31243 RepID=A0A914I2C6_GLORO
MNSRSSGSWFISFFMMATIIARKSSRPRKPSSSKSDKKAAKFGLELSGRKIRAGTFGPQNSGWNFRAAKFGLELSGRKIRAGTFGPQNSGRKFRLAAQIAHEQLSAVRMELRGG